MKDGLLPVVAFAGGVSAMLLWSMSMNDPYWRLFDAPRVPVTTSEPAMDQRALLKTAMPDYGNTDAGAMSPSTDPLASTERTDFSLEIIAHEAEAASIPEPMIAIAPLLELEPMAGPAFDTMIAYEMPRTAALAPVFLGTETDLVIALAPTPLPAPTVLSDRDPGAVATAVSEHRLDPFVAPAPPAQLRFAATEHTEEALGLGLAERIDVQRRLALAGFDPNGFDGAFGPRTRGAITDFQTAWGFPDTGYLETTVVADLNQRTEDAYQALRRQAAAAPSSAPELAPIARERQIASVEVKGRCARRSDGRIIEHQSFVCDLAGFSESFVSLGRNSLNDEDEDGTVVAAQTSLTDDTDDVDADR
jgi:peptidoglycan hydrolase-like protein with peptidoglycan-binding domain